MRKIAKIILLALSSFIAMESNAQLVGSNAYLKGNFVEIGVSSCGVFGTVAPVPTGYHPNASGLGFVADADKDGWTVGSPPFCGDYFVPGDPEEGFTVEINGVNYGNFQNNCSTNSIPGSITGYTNTGGVTTVTWTGLINGLQITQVTTLNANDLHFVTNVTLTNTSAALMSNVFYMRNVDPDNDVMWSNDFKTQNSIVNQPGINGCPRALVQAKGLHSSCFLGLGTIDRRARVTYGGFLNRIASDVWNGTGFYQAGSNIDDAAISLAYNIGNLAAGASAQITYAYILNAADLINVLPLPTNPPVTANGIDISTTNLFKGCINERVNVVINDGGNFTWVWTPNTDIFSNDNNGSNVVIIPTATRTYHLVGTNACGQQVTKDITVQVTTKPTANAGPDRTICPASYTNLGTSYTWPHTYSWTATPAGPTIPAVFNPSVSPSQTTTYTLTETMDGCSATDEVKVTVLNNVTITGPTSICVNGTGYVYSIPDIPGATYNWWINGSGSITSGQGTKQVTVSFPYFTGGSINVGVNMAGCYFSVALPITIGGTTISVTPSSATICTGTPVTLTASGASTYTWSPSTGLTISTPSGASVIANPATTTTYTVTGTAGSGCAGTKTVTITVTPCDPCGTAPVYKYSKLSATRGGLDVSNIESGYVGRDEALIGDFDGDGVEDIVMGSIANITGVPSGSIHILFMNSNGTVKSQKDITDGMNGFSNTIPSQYGYSPASFGAVVTYLGDIDGPGGSVGAVMVGAPGDNDGTFDDYNYGYGAVYVLFLKADGTVYAFQKISQTQGNFTADLDGSVPAYPLSCPFTCSPAGFKWGIDGDAFGRSVEYLGDLDGAGPSVAAIAVGADGDDDGATGDPRLVYQNGGAVYILFIGADGKVLSYKKISASTPALATELGYNARLGRDIQKLGDLDGTGPSAMTLAITASFKIYLVDIDAAGNYLSHTSLSLTMPSLGGIPYPDPFKKGLGSLGDLDGAGPGKTTLMFGYGSKIYLVNLDQNKNVLQYYFIGNGLHGLSLDPTTSGFGYSIAAVGDLNNDGNPEIAVTEQYDADGGPNTGAVYLISICPGLLNTVAPRIGASSDELNVPTSTVMVGKADVMPNPFETSFLIRLPDGKTAETVEVTDMNGAKVASYKDVTDNASIGENLNSGIYLLKVVSNNTVYYIKVIKL